MDYEKNEKGKTKVDIYGKGCIRFMVLVWQAIGAVAGVLAIKEVMPEEYKHMLGGPSLKVDLHTGAIAEGVLTFLITFAVLVIILKGPRSPIFKMWLLAVATVAMVVAGSSYTGPSMNPANVSKLSLSLLFHWLPLPDLCLVKFLIMIWWCTNDVWL